MIKTTDIDQPQVQVLSEQELYYEVRKYLDTHIKRLNGTQMFKDKVILMPDIPKTKTDSGIITLNSGNLFVAGGLKNDVKEALKDVEDYFSIVSGYIINMGSMANKEPGYESLDLYSRVYYRKSIYDVVVGDGIPYMVMRITDLFGHAPTATQEQFETQKKIRDTYEKDIRKSMDYMPLVS